MNRFRIAAIAALFILPLGAYSQDWLNMIKSGSANLHDVQSAFYQWYNTQHKQDDDKIKQGNGGEEDDGSYEQFKRWEWFMESRTYPTGKLPDRATIISDYQKYLADKATQRSAQTQTSSGSWTYAGNINHPNGGGAGRVNRIRFYPGSTDTLFACTPSGGLWKSTDGGATWSTNTDKLLDLAISDIAIDPVNPNVMYIGTGDNDGISSGYTPSTIGVLKSTDGGNTWNATPLYYTIQSSATSEITVNKLLINPNDHNMVYAATSMGLFRSTDAGNGWLQVINGSVKDIEFEPFHPSTIYASTPGGWFYRSTDNGTSFSKITNGITGKGMARMAIAVTPADSNIVYALVEQQTSYGFYGLYRSDDKGQSFNLQSSSPNLLGWAPNGNDFGGQGWYTLALAASPTDANHVLVGGVNIWESNDGGASWSLNAEWTGSGAPYVHADIHQLSFLPNSDNTYYAACDGGVFKTTNSGSIWNDLSNGLEIAEEYSIGLSGSNSSLWLTGWQDNGTNKAGSPSNQVLGGDGMVCFIDNTNDNNMYGEMYNGSFYASSNGGASWNYAASGITETGPWVTRWIQDPQSPNTLFAGFNNVWKSANKGASWNQLSNFFTLSPVTAIAVAPSDDKYIYVAQAGALYGTTDGGTTWNNIGNSLPYAAGEIQGIAVDPSHPYRVWVTFSGYLSTCKVFQSVDTGRSWSNLSVGLPNLPVNCIAYQAGSPDGIYIGTDMGVYYRDTVLKTWVDFNSGLPNVIVYDLKIYGPGSLLRAATYGRGTWQTPLYNPPVAAPVARFTAYPKTICANNTIQLNDTSDNQPTAWSWTFQGGSPLTSTLQNPQVQYSAPGTYYVKLVATNMYGSDTLTDSNYITVKPLPPAPTITQSANLDTLTCSLTGMESYEWFLSGQSIVGDSNKYYPVWWKGSYKVICLDTNGCTSSAIFNAVLAGVNELSSKGDIVVYPTVTEGKVQVLFNTQGDYTLGVSNLLGQTLFTKQLHASKQNVYSFDFSAYGKGMYFVTISTGKTRTVRKVVVE